MIDNVVNQQFEEFDISHLRRGDPHPFKDGYVLASWRKGDDGLRFPFWMRERSFFKRNGTPKWRNEKNYTDRVILRRPIIVEQVSEPSMEVPPQPQRTSIITEGPSLLPPEEIVLSRYLVSKRKFCKTKNIPFGLSKENIPSVPPLCPILGIPLLRNIGFPDDFSPSLDRIIPDKGYVPENVIWISNRANRIKTNATWQEIRKVADFYEKLCPDMSGIFVPSLEAAHDLGRFFPMEEMPEPKKTSYKPSQDEIKRVLSDAFKIQDKEWDSLHNFERSIRYQEAMKYHLQWKEANGWKSKVKAIQAEFRWAFPQWKMHHIGRGEIRLYPTEIQQELSGFSDKLGEYDVMILSQAIIPLMRLDECFKGKCEKHKKKAYIFQL